MRSSLERRECIGPPATKLTSALAIPIHNRSTRIHPGHYRGDPWLSRVAKIGQLEHDSSGTLRPWQL